MALTETHPFRYESRIVVVNGRVRWTLYFKMYRVAIVVASGSTRTVAGAKWKVRHARRVDQHRRWWQR